MAWSKACSAVVGAGAGAVVVIGAVVTAGAVVAAGSVTGGAAAGGGGAVAAGVAGDVDTVMTSLSLEECNYAPVSCEQPVKA
jgi:hypothetical protein